MFPYHFVCSHLGCSSSVYKCPFRITRSSKPIRKPYHVVVTLQWSQVVVLNEILFCCSTSQNEWLLPNHSQLKLFNDTTKFCQGVVCGVVCIIKVNRCRIPIWVLGGIFKMRTNFATCGDCAMVVVEPDAVVAHIPPFALLHVHGIVNLCHPNLPPLHCVFVGLRLVVFPVHGEHELLKAP